MAEIVHLTSETVKAIHQEVLRQHGGLDGLRDEGLLHSAVLSPQVTWGGEPLFSDPVKAAAAYLFYLCKNHPFNDGNKRTALACCLVVLKANHLISQPSIIAEKSLAWEQLTIEVAEGKISREETAIKLQALLIT
ncbi:MAG: Fic family protein [Opitutales bacterium]|jgi:death-on-curing protein